MKTWRAVIVLLASTGLVARAADVGDPVFPKDMNDKARAELIYENLQRGLDLDSKASHASDKIEADAYLLRMHTDLGSFGYLDFDVGALDPSGGDMAFYGGVGLRYLAYDSQRARLSTVAQLHYAPNVSGKDEDYDYLDGDLALLAALKINVDQQLTVMPYVGPVLSIVRLNGDAQTVGGSESFDADQDQVLGVAAGISLQLQGQNGLRIEARYFDDVSISAAASLAF